MLLSNTQTADVIGFNLRVQSSFIVPIHSGEVDEDLVFLHNLTYLSKPYPFLKSFLGTVYYLIRTYSNFSKFSNISA